MDTSLTLVDVLRRRAIENPNQVGYTFLDDGETESCNVTYAELDLRARAIGNRLNSVCAVGDRVLLLYSPGLQFVTAFLGCLYAGAAAVPTYFLDPENIDRAILQLIPTIQDVNVRVAIGTTASLNRIQSCVQSRQELNEIYWIAADTTKDELASEWTCPAICAQTLALVHYTSGSTGTPKGVMVNHRNLLWRTDQERERYRPGSSHLTWRPIVHSGGLNHAVIRPLITGVRSIIMPPEAFLQKPVRWLRAISRYSVATSSGPNFAYDLCSRRVNPGERKGIDLASWTTAFVVAEQINPFVLDRFANEYSPWGFRREAFAARYGLTESTGLISCSPYGRGLKVLSLRRASLVNDEVIVASIGDASAVSFVSAGRILNERVVIVDPITLAECPKGKIGEIWVSSRNAAQGYWSKLDESRLTFKAVLSGTQDGPFLRTGDLGFIYDHELYVTGRLKELINIHGRKIYPQDIESTVENCHTTICSGQTASFSIRSEFGERLVIVHELRNGCDHDLNELIERIRGAVFNDQGVMPYVVLLVKPGSIARTANGKIQRQACRDAYLRGAFKATKTSIVEQSDSDYRDGARSVSPQSSTQERLATIWTSVLARKRVGIYETFLDLGGNLDLASKCRDQVRAAFGVELSIELFLSDVANVRELADIIDRLIRPTEMPSTETTV